MKALVAKLRESFTSGNRAKQ